MNLIRTIKTNVVYDNTYVTVYDDDVEFPSGSAGKYFRYRWKSPHGVAVVPVTDDGFVLLIRTHKYGNIDLTLEIPQGFGSAGSTPELDARRELFEETGYEVENLSPLLVLGDDFQTHVFQVAVQNMDGVTNSHAEDNESITGYTWIAIDEITPSILKDLRVIDSVSMAALFAVKSERLSRHHENPS